MHMVEVEMGNNPIVYAQKILVKISSVFTAVSDWFLFYQVTLPYF